MRYRNNSARARQAIDTATTGFFFFIRLSRGNFDLRVGTVISASLIIAPGPMRARVAFMIGESKNRRRMGRGDCWNEVIGKWYD